MRRLLLTIALVALSCLAYGQGIVIRNSNDPDNPSQEVANPIAAARLPAGSTSLPQPTWSAAGAGAIPARETVCQTLGTDGQASTFVQSVTAASINTAISNCTAGQTVKLETGTYNSLGGITWAGKNNVTLRGEGANATLLNFSSTSEISCNGLGSAVCMIDADGGWSQDAPGTSANWTGGLSQGSTQITLASVTGLGVGELLVLDRIDNSSDPGTEVWICSGLACTEQGTDIGRGSGASKRGQSEIHKVTAINEGGCGSTCVTITPSVLHPNWAQGAQDPEAWWNGGAPAVGMGIEDLSLNFTSSNATYGIQIQMCDGCWVKGVRSLNADNAHINPYLSHGVTIRDSYFYGAKDAASQSYGFEPWMGGNHLWENNIFQHQTSPMVLSGASGVVAGYNYALDDYYCSGGCSGWFQAAMYHHESGSSWILWESNDVPGWTGDNIHGPGVFTTAFRNRIDGKDPNNLDPKTDQTVPVNISAQYRFFNVVGNVLGYSGYHDTYQVNTSTTGTQDCDDISADPNGQETIYRLGWAGNCNNVDGPGDPTVDDVMMRWGNWDVVTSTSDNGSNDQTGTKWTSGEVPTGISQYANAIPASQALPSSMYLSARPGFYTNVLSSVTPAWPSIGPDVVCADGDCPTNVGSHVVKIPARRCYESLSNDGGNSYKVFNRATCYPGS